MKNRILVIWMAGLTIYTSYCANDTYRVLKNLENGQYCTMKYMEKSCGILVRIKKSPLLVGEQAAAAATVAQR